MDNLTHSLVGVLLGEVGSRQANLPRKAAVWTSVIASNLPDLDVVCNLVHDEGNLFYLLHHRGWTHSLLAVIPLGVFSSFFGNKIGNNHKKLSGKLILLGVLAAFLHIAADYCNNYGVHPFSPFLNRWFYGDFLFIAEPFILFILIPYVFFRTQSQIYKILLILFEIILAGALFLISPKIIALMICCLGGLSFFIHYKKTKSLPSVLGIGCVLIVFKFASVYARNKVVESFNQTKDRIKIDQIVTSPAPGNPFCWAVIAQGVDQDKNYIARTGIVSLAPTLISEKICDSYAKLSHPWTQPVSYNKLNFWKTEFKKPLAELNEGKKYCLFENFLKFSRIPIWNRTEMGWEVEDLRYAGKTNGGFTYREIKRDSKCFQVGAPWEPPTAILRP